MAGTSSNKGSASKIIAAIREATGASVEDIQMVLKECNHDVNEATARLIDSTWRFFVFLLQCLFLLDLGAPAPLKPFPAPEGYIDDVAYRENSFG
jgi:hypothetical protein